MPTIQCIQGKGQREFGRYVASGLKLLQTEEGAIEMRREECALEFSRLL